MECKKIYISILFLLFVGTIQAQKIKIMVIPADTWMKHNDFWESTSDDIGGSGFPNYQKAFEDNTDLANVLELIASEFADEDYELEDLQSKLKSNDAGGADDLIGDVLGEDEKTEDSNSYDYYITMDWNVKDKGMGMRQIDFKLTAKDRIAGTVIVSSQGTTEESYETNTTLLLRESVKNTITKLKSGIKRKFNRVRNEGNKMTLAVASKLGKMRELHNGQTLEDIVLEWMKNNSQGGKFVKAKATKKVLKLKPVYVSMQYLDASEFMKVLQKYLRSLNIETELRQSERSPNEAVLILK